MCNQIHSFTTRINANACAAAAAPSPWWPIQDNNAGAASMRVAWQLPNNAGAAPPPTAYATFTFRWPNNTGAALNLGNAGGND